MYDSHYDLLTIIYFNLKKYNPKANKEKLINDCINIYKEGNIDGGIINLYFMSPEEMIDELGITKEECEDVKGMFKSSIDGLKKLQEEGIIPKNKKFIFSIEGCDFIKDPNELLHLYNMGLRVIIPVWNNENRYGSGNKTEYGLKVLGKELIKLAISLGIAIDLSHANIQTFNDIMDIVEYSISNGKNPIVLASHSNARSICDRKRNLTAEQIIRLKNAGGYLGLFSNGNFVSKDNEKIPKEKRKENFVNMISYVVNDLGYPKDKILLATDDMNFNPDKSYHGLETFNLFNIKEETEKSLIPVFGKEVTKMFMKYNFEDLYIKINNRKYKDPENTFLSYNNDIKKSVK